jgi:hypothetical protein
VEGDEILSVHRGREKFEGYLAIASTAAAWPKSSPEEEGGEEFEGLHMQYCSLILLL